MQYFKDTFPKVETIVSQKKNILFHGHNLQYLVGLYNRNYLTREGI